MSKNVPSPLSSPASPNKGMKNQKWLPHPRLLGGPQVGGNATTPAVSGIPQQRGTKSELAASPVLSQGPTSERKRNITPHTWGSPGKRGQYQKWLPHPCLLGPTNGQQTAFSEIPKQRGTKWEVGTSMVPSLGPYKWAGMLHHPSILNDPNTRGDKIRIGCLTPAFSGAHKSAQRLHTPAFLGIRKQRGTKSELATSRLPSWGPTSGRKCYIAPAFSGNPQTKGGKNQKWLPHPSLLGPTSGRKGYITPAFSGIPKQKGTKSELVASHLPSRGPTSGWKCYVTPAVSGIPKQRGMKLEVATSLLASRGQQMGRNKTAPHILGDPQTKGDKIKSGYLSTAFSKGNRATGGARLGCVGRSLRHFVYFKACCYVATRDGREPHFATHHFTVCVPPIADRSCFLHSSICAVVHRSLGSPSC